VSKRRDCEERFRERYGAPVSEAALVVEREVIGANVGANGYTTVKQADMLSARLGLTPTTRLLDIGSGRGWPALYLTAKIGCRTALIDLPEPALRTALRNADKQDLSEVCVVRASGDRLPFASDSFDVVTHTDTL
jgi:ubiquinone/menaquinone biosynthesis C-methylase UbiE